MGKDVLGEKYNIGEQTQLNKHDPTDADPKQSVPCGLMYRSSHKKRKMKHELS